MGTGTWKLNLGAELTVPEIIKAADNYHYREKDLLTFQAVYRAMQPVRARAYLRVEAGRLECAVTLGAAPDELQEQFVKQGRLTECFMVECLTMECLKKMYPEIAKAVAERYGVAPDTPQFPGSDMPAGLIGDILGRLDQGEIRCNEAYMLLPQKSVVYTAMIPPQDTSHMKTKKGETGGLCDSCANKECLMRGKLPAETRGKQDSD